MPGDAFYSVLEGLQELADLLFSAQMEILISHDPSNGCVQLKQLLSELVHLPTFTGFRV